METILTLDSNYQSLVIQIKELIAEKDVADDIVRVLLYKTFKEQESKAQITIDSFRYLGKGRYSVNFSIPVK